MNQCHFNGRICNDLEIKQFGDSKVLKFRIAVNGRKYKDKGGQEKQDVTFLDCDAWGSGAERINEYFAKGDAIIVTGSLCQDEWEKDGQKRTKHFLRVDRFDFPVGNARKEDGEPKKAAPAKAKKAAPADDNGQDEDSRIPF